MFVSIPYRYGTTGVDNDLPLIQVFDWFQFLIGTVQREVVANMVENEILPCVSIPLRYGTTTAFTVFLFHYNLFYFSFETIDFTTFHPLNSFYITYSSTKI